MAATRRLADMKCQSCKFWEAPVADSSGTVPENGKCWLPFGDEKEAPESLPTPAYYGCLWWEKKGPER